MEGRQSNNHFRLTLIDRVSHCRLSSSHLIFYSLKTVVKRNCVQSSYAYRYNKMLW